MMNEDYQRGGEEFYDNQEGGMFERFIGRPKTATVKAIDMETNRVPLRGPGTKELITMPLRSLAVPKRKDSIPTKVTPPRSLHRDKMKDVDPNKIKDAMTSTSSMLNALYRPRLKGEFLTNFKLLLEDLILKNDKKADTYIVLDLEKVKLIKRLCDMSHFNTMECAKDIFSSIKSSKLLIESDSKFITMTEDIFKPYLEPVFFLEATKTFIKDNIAELFKFSDDFLRFILQLLVIHYYPIFLLRTIRDKIIIAVKYIKSAQDSLSEKDESITKFSKLINSISGDPNTQGGGTWWSDKIAEMTGYRGQSDADALQSADAASPFASATQKADDAQHATASLAARVDLEEANNRAATAAQLLLDESNARREEALQALADERRKASEAEEGAAEKAAAEAAAAEAAAAEAKAAAARVEAEADASNEKNRNLLKKYIKEYNGTNSYVTNSHKLFYYALINFAVSISVDSNDYYKKKISQDLETEFKKLLDVKPDNNVNLEDFQQELQKKKELKAAAEEKITSKYKRDYNGHKRTLKFLTAQLKLDNLSEREKASLEFQLENAEEAMKHFKDDLISSQQEDFSKREMVKLFQKEEAVAGAERALAFLPTINNKKQRMITQEEIKKIIGNILLLNTISFDYTTTITRNINVGIKESNIFTFTDNGNPKAATSASDTRAETIAEERSTTEELEARADAMEAEYERSQAAEEEAKDEWIAAMEAVKAADQTQPNAVADAKKREVAARIAKAEASAEMAGKQRNAYAARVKAQAAAANELRQQGGKRRTRRYKKRAGTRRYKKRAGTRRHKKRSGTHRKRKNTTR